MTTNSSNITSTEEFGWRAAPLARGTMDILWSCTSVVVLITWTNFHPPVGASRKQRVLTAITATLFPALPALVALKDLWLARHLAESLRSMPEPNTWKGGWSLTKSFLVVKGGVRLRAHRRQGRPSGLLSPGGNSDDATAGEHTVEPQTFQMLARGGNIRYEDFPASEEIRDKSKADWVAKSITLLQLFWTIVNVGCRNAYGCPVSLLERLMLEWVVLGFTALVAWWRCPQNIAVPYYLPFRDCHELMAMSQSTHEPPIPTGGFPNGLETSTRSLGMVHDAWISMVVILPGWLIAWFHRDFFHILYQWHSTHAHTVWTVSTAAYTLSAFLVILTDYLVRFNWSTQYFKTRYEQLVLPRTPEPGGRSHGRCSIWQKLATGMGLYKATELDAATHIFLVRKDIGLIFMGLAVVVVLASQFVRLLVALTAFSSAPRGIYDVPSTWILEVLVHVGR